MRPETVAGNSDFSEGCFRYGKAGSVAICYDLELIKALKTSLIKIISGIFHTQAITTDPDKLSFLSNFLPNPR